MGRGADISLDYRKVGEGQPQANRLAGGAELAYALQLRDRCRSGLSGSPGKRVLGKTNRGFESLPVRPYYVPQPRDFEGLGGQGVSPPRGEKWLGLGVTGDQSLPVRPYYVPQPRDFEGLGGQRYFLTQRSLTLLRPAVAGLRRARGNAP